MFFAVLQDLHVALFSLTIGKLSWESCKTFGVICGPESGVYLPSAGCADGTVHCCAALS